ncbi:uncharacterized protein LOC142138332 isoform X2 [Mixophyes fleayi]
MPLNLRIIIPCAVPGVLAIVGCWWFFSRKKKWLDKKPNHIISLTELQTDEDVFKELNETQCSSRTQPVDLSCETHASLSNFTCSTPSAERVASFSETLSDCKADGLKSETSTLNVELDSSILPESQDKAQDKELYVVSSTEPSAQPCIDEMQTEQCPQSVDNDSETEHSSAHYSECNQAEEVECSKPLKPNLFPPMEAHIFEHDNSATCGVTGSVLQTIDELSNICIKSSSMEMLSENNATDKMDTFSQCLGKPELLQTTDKETTKTATCDFASCSADVSHGDSTDVEHTLATIQVMEPAASLNQPHLVTEETLIGSKATSAVCSVTCSEVEALNNNLSEELLVVRSPEQSVQPCIGEIETMVKMSLLVQCPQSVANETGVESREEAEQGSYPSLESIRAEQIAWSKPKSNQWCPMEAEGFEHGDSAVCEIAGNVLPTSDDLSSSMEMVREGKCADILDAFSQCLGKNEQYETTGSVVDCLEEGNPNTIFGDYEAKIVEQLAINIISKVIVAAKQEIMSGSASDMSGTCQVLDEKNGKFLQRDSQRQQFALDKNGTDANGESGSLTEISSTCEATQTEQSQVEELKNGLMTGDIPTHPSQSLANFSPVHKMSEFFDESQAAMEDSSVSVCTSEDGIIVEEPLQSTVLSSVCVGSYESLSSSGIELSRDNVNVSSERSKNVGAVENKSVPYGNGDVKSSSVDMKNEGPWTGDTEVYHSGGSDVNSMDSVDSGCALGKSEQVQDVNDKNVAKKAEFVIWEFEVPKHLVGRLIGKQGRFVSFLKELSGAKIYISTLPYTHYYQICHIEGSQEQIDRALYLIGKKFKELNFTNIYAPPPSVVLHSLPMTSWLMLPERVTVEVIVVNVVNAGHLFVQQHAHPTFHALRGLDQLMSLCYTQSGIPTLPTPVEVGVICAAPIGDHAWWRAQVVAYHSESEEVELRYVDYGGYDRVKIALIRQIRSDFVTLPFQGAEILLDNVIPLQDEDHFSIEADEAANDITRGTALLAQVTNYDAATGLPLVHLWSVADEVVSINRTLVERGYAQWVDSH